jgi:ATP-dependent RNA helicase DeaD
VNEFEKFGINDEIIEAITLLGFEKFTPIQEQSIPVLMSGDRDFIGLAQTGTGKTAAFGIPILQLLDFGINKTQALILAPTRELCVQIANDLETYAKFMHDVKIVAVYGGASIQHQITAIKKGVQIVVATPGRLLDLIGRKAINISTIRIVVLDEADEMLNMGFQEDLDTILDSTPDEKLTWLFAATMPSEVHAITRKYMRNPFELTVGKKNTTAENIEHQYYVVHAKDRYATLKRIVDANPDIFGIVFCRTKIETQEIAEKLIKDGYNADSLHGDLSQIQRDKVMKRYREKSLQLLIATDVAARGIDVNDVTHVINYNLPDEVESYTHRSGRTARAGKSGISISIVNTKEVDKIKQIERLLNRKFVYSRVPGGVEVCERQLIGLIKKIHEVEVDEKGIAKYLPSIYEELQDLDKEQIIKRVVSIEFNRFLEYYWNAHDINIDFSQKDHVRSRDVYKTGSSMFINLGSMDGFDPGRMLKYLSEMSGQPGSIFGKIDIKGVYSFIDIEESKIDEVLSSFKNEVYKGRKIRVDVSGGTRKRQTGKPENRRDRQDDRQGNRRPKRQDDGQGDRRPERQENWSNDRSKSFSKSDSRKTGKTKRKRI